jgi:protein-tyrosine phosphatase
MGAGLLQHALAAQSEPLRSIKVLSAGIAAREGEIVSENSVIALRKVGIDISRHRSQPVTQKLLDDALLVLCMTESHRAMIQLQAESVPEHLHLFREFMPRQAEKEVPDPFGGPLKLYELCRDELVEAVPSPLTHIRKLTAAR